MARTLSESYQHCARLTREQAGNFYYSFLCLPPEKRAAMYAIYAFMRHSDDLSDGVTGDRASLIRSWRASLDRALQGEYGDSAILPAFHDAVRRYGIPTDYFYQLIDGTQMDLKPRPYLTFDDTYRYCYHVASIVGLVCIHVWGFSDPRALQLAEWNGIAFQLTNIRRDVGEDAEMGRVYLPREDLERFGYSEEELLNRVDNQAFRRLMAFEVARAQEYYDRSAPLIELIEPECRPCLRAMREIYHGILQRIVAQGYDVYSCRARVPTWKKVAIAAQAIWRSRRVKGRSVSSA